MKLWLLDADVIIKLLELDVFDLLVDRHEVHVASTVIGEVKYFRRQGRKVGVDFRGTYVESGRVVEDSATVEQMREVVARLPVLKQQVIHAGELEALAILVNREDLTLCTFDAAAIRTLPFLDASDRSVSAERLLQASGLKLSPGHKLDARLTEEYFRSNLEHGQLEFIQTVR